MIIKDGSIVERKASWVNEFRKMLEGKRVEDLVVRRYNKSVRRNDILFYKGEGYDLSQKMFKEVSLLAKKEKELVICLKVDDLEIPLCRFKEEDYWLSEAVATFLDKWFDDTGIIPPFVIREESYSKDVMFVYNFINRSYGRH